jgi:alkanesulfonate monooxygenase SsuD/methylene tetrahydromethanopterin reductase-like flavin-dependent oxidoreductase (luciferase family)/FAD/FMN-containing dehydrogenase
MPDYGHPLQFGTFITPGNSPAQRPVQLAQLSEQLGYDLVTFQDHPYQAAFHDTWTLMSWVAAVTERIHIAGNVLNLPMRQPAVLARSVASLDLLSGGRIELGIGAGGFWDAIEAMGGDRLTPGQGVDALSQAIDIIRGIWDAGDRSPLRAGGQYHSVSGAKRGPAPAHEVPIWIGALKPRMLRLIGTKGDGWLPSLPYLKPGDLAAGNATIDQAALDAGRDPREIRRLLNIGGAMESDEVVRLVLEEGISTFIVMGDDPDVLAGFAELLPDIRDAVAAERASSGTPQGRARGEAALARRRDNIDYDGVPPSLAADAIEPGDSHYSRVKNNYMRGGAPGIVLRPSTVDEVVDAVAFARAHPDIPLGVRSGGHGISGRSTNDGGIVIDLGRLNAIEVVDDAARRVRIGPGARWQDVAGALAPHGWALTSGDYGGVGVGGLATAGGIGWLARQHGLTIDHLRAADLVLASGEVVHASDTENPELFWALRGAGANMGIAVSFEFEVDEVGEVGWAQLAFDASDTAGFIERWGAAVEAAPRALTSNLLIGRSTPGQPTVAQVMAMVDSSDPDRIIEILQPLAGIAPLAQQSVQLLPYATVMSNSQGTDHHGQGEPIGRSAFIEHFTPEVAAAMARLIDSGEAYFFQVRSVGGAVGDIAPDATAYAHRDANFSVVALGGNRSRLDAQWDTLISPHATGLYLSFETDPRPERIEDAFPPATLRRLRALKSELDPGNLFRDNFNVALNVESTGAR